METLDPAAEWLRLSEHYRQMTNDELLALGRQISEMTELAQQILAQEMSQRKLKLEPDEPAEEPTEGHFEASAPPSQTLNGVSGPDTAAAPDIYAQDRELVEICTVWSVSDALQVQRLLDTAGIPFFMGKEKATGVGRDVEFRRWRQRANHAHWRALGESGTATLHAGKRSG